jgi:hypothetical protein
MNRANRKAIMVYHTQKILRLPRFPALIDDKLQPVEASVCGEGEAALNAVGP